LDISILDIRGLGLKSFRESRKAVSPVISTIIIVAVAIAISIAVAFWLGGITGIFTRFEKLEIPTAYATRNGTDGWTITLEVKNTGTTSTTITDVLINGIPLDMKDVEFTDDGANLNPGEGATITILSLNGIGDMTFASGQAVTITLHTSGGQDYPKTVVLP
jgi:FlaG/FlaF family flagellin (archaellin)